MNYPKSDGYDDGCKVSWLYYRSEAAAKKAAAIAAEERDRLLRLGYDFGFQWPGSINKVTAGKFEGMFQVTTP